MLDNLKIKIKCEDMILYSQNKLKQYPRHEKRRGGLVDDTHRAELELLRLIVVCNHKYFKKTTLQDMDTTLDMLRSFIRMGYKQKFLDLHSYEVWSAKVDEIGRMIGGWIKAMKENRAADK